MGDNVLPTSRRLANFTGDDGITIQEKTTMAQSYTNLLYHIVFAVKDRRPLITDEYQPIAFSIECEQFRVQP